MLVSGPGLGMCPLPSGPLHIHISLGEQGYTLFLLRSFPNSSPYLDSIRAWTESFTQVIVGSLATRAPVPENTTSVMDRLKQAKQFGKTLLKGTPENSAPNYLTLKDSIPKVNRCVVR